MPQQWNRTVNSDVPFAFPAPGSKEVLPKKEKDDEANFYVPLAFPPARPQGDSAKTVLIKLRTPTCPFALPLPSRREVLPKQSTRDTDSSDVPFALSVPGRRDFLQKTKRMARTTSTCP